MRQGNGVGDGVRDGVGDGVRDGIRDGEKRGGSEMCGSNMNKIEDIKQKV